MLASERQQALLALLKQNGAFRTKDLARELGASEATIRRDLRVLSERGELHREHGGAVVLEQEPPYSIKIGKNQAVKEAIARKALQYVEEGMTLILDSGTTTLALARLLAGLRVRVFALDLVVAQTLAQGHTEVWLPGGLVRNGFYSLTSQWVLESLAQIKADLFFLGADAFDLFEVTNHTLEEAFVKKKALAVADRTVLLADGSKFGHKAVARVTPLSALFRMVTDLEHPALAEVVPVEVVRA
ncbi:DeoR/GlpR family DNA-binding transcription regulator [Meiothermus sp.]|uniref:DeoR/GlpR family DNA-binding transcription regulator n=1 Tax=Meiothermus sp. TaxID=1955249 RepID=UPI0021DE1131|nr:DeoR/GlpR family DNA-binding transcription regulator [Meiothermus sp.]GIW35212.1 MAG: DeoR family transcriptional regulator [Meiothermus sp.]